MVDFISRNRKILISLFLIIGVFSAIIDGVILAKRPQILRSRASEALPVTDKSPTSTKQFVSPGNKYSVTFDQKEWTHAQQPDPNFGSRVIFNLNKEHGSARLDIIEGESTKDLISLTNDVIQQSPKTAVKAEPMQFKDQASYLITYQEEILGQDVFAYQQVVKADNSYYIFEKRAPLLGYNQFYLDNLLENISLGSPQPSPQVKGISETSSKLTTIHLVELIRPSIAYIVYFYCLDIINLAADSGLPSPNYQFCSASKGSGFVINDQGTVATNGHVVKVYPEEGLVTNLLNEGNKTFSTDLIRGIYLSSGQNPPLEQIEAFYRELNLNPQYLDRFLSEIFRLIDNKIISVSTSSEKYYVNVGSEPLRIAYEKLQQKDYANAIIPSSTTYTAKLLDFNYPNKYSYEAIVNKNYQRGADVALLQIESVSNHLFPALELGNIEKLKEGSEVIVAGYPTLVEGEEDPRAAISYKTSTKPTITRGIVSAIKKDLTNKTVLQTDASIDHGNSGGPAFNELGQVIGIATFAAESKSGNFNFLRDIAELKELMLKNNVDNKLGGVTASWRMGLNEFWNKYYNNAVKKFNEVESASPNHPTIKEFITQSKEAIQKGESYEGIAGFIKSGKITNIILAVFGGVSVISFMSAGFLSLLPLFLRRNGINTTEF